MAYRLLLCLLVAFASHEGAGLFPVVAAENSLPSTASWHSRKSTGPSIAGTGSDEGPRRLEEDLELLESPRSRLRRQQEQLLRQESRERVLDETVVVADETEGGSRRSQAGSEEYSEDDAVVVAKSLLNGVTSYPDAPGSRSIRDPKECLEGLEKFTGINRSAPFVGQFACMVHRSLQQWMPIEGVKEGMGSRGLIAQSTLQSLSKLAQIMSCCGHIRIVDGIVYFRYGGFFFHWYRLLRFVQSVKMIKRAVRRYKLFSLRAEFFLNTCDLPMSYDSSLGGDKSGIPIFSTEHAAGSIDILYPDPLDLTAGYITLGKPLVPWSRKLPKAIFRGGATNYRLDYDGHWRGSPRFRLHRMTDVRPDLIDARIMRILAPEKIASSIERDGVARAPPMSKERMASFKYELVVDGGSGSCRTCGVLASDMAMVRQESDFSEFFQPLLQPWKHFIPTSHNFEDLFERIEWAQRNDKSVRKMISNAHRVARWACSWDGRMLYWAVLLAKYSSQALEDPSAVRAPPPSQLRNCSAPPRIEWMTAPAKGGRRPPMPEGYPPRCNSETEMEAQAPCSYFCVSGRLHREKHVWVKASLFDKIDPVGPRMSAMPKN